MRRSSLFAPLLLIGLGGLFLAHNLNRDLPLLDYLAKYWPFLLIIWGVLRMGEVLFWAATKQPLPMRGVSGGEWVFVIFLCFFGATLHAALGFSSWFPRSRFELGSIEIFGESFDYPIASEKSVSKSPHIVIESFRGNARITGSTDNTVKVSGRKIVRSMDQNGAERANQDTPFEITGDNDRIVIRTNQDRASASQRVSDDLEISVPKGASIEAHGRRGDFDVTNVDGSVTIDSDNAGVRLEGIGGETRLDLRASDIVRAINVKGNFELRGNGADIDLENIDGAVTINGAYTGNVQFQNLAKPLHFVGPQTEVSFQKLAGQIRMPLGTFNASNLEGPVRLDTRSRDVQISDFTNAIEVSVDRGDIELRPSLPLAKIDAHTRAGNIVLAMPPDAKFDLTATTNRGDVNNEFGDALKIDQSRHGAQLRGSNGGPQLSLTSNTGEITVRKATPGEPPFAPRREREFGKGFRGPKQLKRFDQ
jgi:DUF4097 and DUF4098 domain-containing protein YvlB